MTSAPYSQKTPPAITPDADWVEVLLPFNIGSGRSLYTGLEGIDRLRLRIYKRKSDGHLIGRAWFGEGADGPPLHVHGGAVAYVLDEAMGAVGWMNEYPVVAASLKFDYFQMTPLLTDLEIEAKITNVTDRRVSTEAEIRLPEGDVYVRATGEFAILQKSKIDLLEAHKYDKDGVLKNPNLKWAQERES